MFRNRNTFYKIIFPFFQFYIQVLVTNIDSSAYCHMYGIQNSLIYQM